MKQERMAPKKQNWIDKFLNIVEKAGNALPHPATLFLLFALLILIASWITSLLNLEATPPGSQDIIKPENLLTAKGVHRILTEMVHNFTDFAPLGIVLVAMLGIGVAESSGLINTLIRKLVLSAPPKLLTFVIVLAGILSNIASNVGYVLLIPMAGIIFLSLGRHPIVGMAAAFAGVSGGFSANLIIGTIDPLLAGLTQEAAQIVNNSYQVNPTANYFFMVASTFIIAIAGTLVTEMIIAPRFGSYQGSVDSSPQMDKLQPNEKKGLWGALLVALILLGIGLWGILPENGFFRGDEGGMLTSPLLKGVVALLFLGAGLCGIVYGLISGTFKSDADIMKGMSKSMSTLSGYLVLVFFASQFVAYFKWSNLGVIFAIKGAQGLMEANVSLIPLVILFILLSAFINMIMGSASAKWAIMAPVFVPMFMFMGYSPELSQVVYRIGDSVTNVISPMMSFFALIIAYFQQYDKESGIGTIISTMLPYSVVFFIIWSLLLILWILLDLPLGPGVSLHYSLPN